MTFLEDLITFERPVKDGGVLLELPLYRRRSLREFLEKSKIQATIYKDHRTVAGLNVVLGHREDGALYVPIREEKELTSSPTINGGDSLREE